MSRAVVSNPSHGVDDVSSLRSSTMCPTLASQHITSPQAGSNEQKLVQYLLYCAQSPVSSLSPDQRTLGITLRTESAHYILHIS